jgi:polyphosphate kinase
MPRNLDQRVELAFPVLDPQLQAEVRVILELQLSDCEKARELGPDGRSRRLREQPGQAFRAQEALYVRATEAIHTRTAALAVEHNGSLGSHSPDARASRSLPVSREVLA